MLSTIYRVRRLSRSYARPTGRGKVYYPFSYTVVITVYMIIVLSAVLEFFVIRGGYGINWGATISGLIMYVAVIPLRAVAIKALGENMSPEVEIKKDHQLIKTGPYSYMRHPLVLYVLIELTGFTLVSNSYYSCLGVLLVFFPVMLLRISLEEQALIDRFGDEYLQYKKEVYALLPIKKRTSCPD